MRLTPYEDELYEEMTKARQESFEQFSRDYSDVQHPKSVEYRDNILGMLFFRKADLEK